MGKIRMKKIAALGLCALLALPLSACQENPEGSIVAHKDMDKLLSQAAASDPEKVDAADVVQEAEEAGNYQTTIENESLGVKVNVNAQVEVPQVDKLSVYRVSQKKIGQDFVDKVRAELLGDTPLYDGSVLDIRTRSQLEQEIAYWRQEIDGLEENYRSNEGAGMSEEDIQNEIQVYREERQNELDRLQEEYENAPVELDMSGYASDGQIHSVADLAVQYPGNYYQWLQGLSAEGDEAFYGITDGSSGEYSLLFVQNNADHSNKLNFRRNPKGYVHFDGVMVGGTGLDSAEQMAEDAFLGSGISDPERFLQENGLSSPVLTNGMYITEGLEFERLYEDAALSQEEAQKTAEDFLAKLGLDAFAFDTGGLYTELLNMEGDTASGKMPYARYYILQYRRQIDGVTLSQSSGGKFADGWSEGGEYNKQFWPGELIEFRINDSGIVGFDYHAPLEITETVVEGATLKTFAQVKETFEQMIPVTLANENYSQVADIERVRLSYSRISEKDSFDTGLVVPVWSFEGKVSAFDEKNGRLISCGPLLAVNAIDNSIINSELGY